MRLPEFVTELSPVRETLEALGAGEDRLAADIEDALRQVHVDTAGRGLDLFEKDFSLARQEEDGLRRALIRAYLSGGRTLTPALLEELCRTIGRGDWGQVNEDFENWTVTAYAAAFGRLPEGSEALDAAVRKLKPAHLAVEAHPAGVFSPEGNRRSGLTGGAWGELAGDDALRGGAGRTAALSGGPLRELSGDDGARAMAERGAASHGAAFHTVSGDDAARLESRRRTAVTGGVLKELWGSDRQWTWFVRRGAALTGCMFAEYPL